MKKNSFKKQSGRSMVEMLGVLAIIGVLSVGAIAGYNMAIEKHRLNEAVEAINLVVQETRALYSSQGNYNGLGEAVSKDWAGGSAGGDSVAARILEKLDIDKYYYPFVLYRAGIDGFAIQVMNLSFSNCVKLNTMNWQEYGNDFGTIAGADGDGKEMTISKAQDWCQEAIDNIGAGVISISFNYVEP